MRRAGSGQPVRVLVTGARGLAGHHVAAVLGHAGLTVLKTSRSPAPDAIELDMTRDDTIRALPDFDVIVNCAGLTPTNPFASWEQYRAVNITAVDALAREARRRSALFVQVSTMGRLRGSRARRRNMYIVSKRLAERCLRHHAAGGLRVWVLRAAAMYGERDRGNMARLIRAIAARRLVYPAGDQRKCFLYAGKLGEAVAEGLRREPESERYLAEFVSHGKAVRFEEIVRTIEDLTGGRAWRIPLPRVALERGLGTAARLAHQFGSRRLLDLATSATVALTDVECSAPNALDRLGILPMPLADGLRREVEWLRADGLIR
jgi:nucleoside-diphosphate-sugar epimerase